LACFHLHLNLSTFVWKRIVVLTFLWTWFDGLQPNPPVPGYPVQVYFISNKFQLHDTGRLSSRYTHSYRKVTFSCLCFSGMWHCITWWLVSNVSRQIGGLITRVKMSFWHSDSWTRDHHSISKQWATITQPHRVTSPKQWRTHDITHI
jgi:hypothetical protein